MENKKHTKLILVVILILFFNISINPLTAGFTTIEKDRLPLKNLDSKTSFSNVFQESTSDIQITDVKGGLNLSITIKNGGTRVYRNVEITFKITGGIIFSYMNKFEIPLLSTEGSSSTCTINNKIVGIGLGVLAKYPLITILADVSGTDMVLAKIEAMIIGPYIKIVDSTLNEENSYQGYTLFAPEYTKDTYLIDNDGDIVHQWNGNYTQGMATYLLEDGNLIRTDISETNPYFPLTILGGSTGHAGIYKPDGSTVWDFKYSNSEHRLHHDIEPLPNGNILMIAAEYKTKNEAVSAGRNPSTVGNKLYIDFIIEVKPNGTSGGDIVWEWHFWDHLIQDYDPSKENYGGVSKHPELIDINVNYGDYYADFAHTNSIDYNEEFDQILLSVRNFNEIWIIDHSTTTEEAATHTGGISGKGGDLLYRWGNPQTYKVGDDEDLQLFHQHDAKWIPSNCPGAGNILVFNNQHEIESNNPNLKYSSVVEIVPPVNNKGKYYKLGSAYGPMNPIWRYTAKNLVDFYSAHLSSAQRLPNGNTLICEGSKGKFFEVTDGGEIVWQYTNPYGILKDVFKVHRYSVDYPGITKILEL